MMIGGGLMLGDIVPWPGGAGTEPQLVPEAGQGFGNIIVLAGAQTHQNDPGGGNYEIVCAGPNGTTQQASWASCDTFGVPNNTDIIHLDRPITLGGAGDYSLGITDFSTAASQVTLIFNGDQIGGENVITLRALALGFWYWDGSDFTKVWDTWNWVDNTLGGQSGQGSAGYGYVLDAAQAQAAQTALNGVSGANLTNIYLGGGFIAGCGLPGDLFANDTEPSGCIATNDGPDDLKIARIAPTTSVPEPASILGLGTVLFLLGNRLRRKKA
jgi:hypothetical protein